ncbi:MAG TPA: DMT family transporter, partial [Verrucomicrobiae bacterium]|nr:DMT family transporter [Verrucomicrobiae bacterium]
WRVDAWLVFLYSVLGPGVFSFALWSNALTHWPTSRVYLFNNIIPVWTVFWTWLFFREPITSNIWIALVLIVSGVVLSSTNWSGVLGKRWLPPE